MPDSRFDSRRLLDIFIERLYASITRGPALNATPGRSRQRIDLADLSAIPGVEPSEVLATLMGESGKWRQRITAAQLRETAKEIAEDAAATDEPQDGNAQKSTTQADVADSADVRGKDDSDEGSDKSSTPGGAYNEFTPPGEEATAYKKAADSEKTDATSSDAAQKKQLRDLKAMLRRLSTIADDAYQFQQDTGAYVLFLGYPLLSIPPSSLGLGKSPRVLAPLAFMPITVVTGKGSAPFVELSGAAVGTELVFMNEAVKVFLEKQLNKPLPEIFEDEEGVDPAREIREITEAVASLLEIDSPPDLTGWPVESVPETSALPDGATILPSAVIGLFRLENQNMISDLQTLKQMETYPPTVAPFLTLNTDLQDQAHGEEIEPESEDIDGSPSRPGLASREQHHDDEYMVTLADPSQRTAVIMARSAKALVVHGPPGTGKSQTIANIVGDYLARDKRVLIVCEKRTALDVVKNRLDHIGLGHLCAVVHDATRDRTALFKMIRERLDILADTQPGNSPEGQLKIVNGDLDNEQGRLRKFLQALREKDESNRNFTELTGEWFRAFHANSDVELPEDKPDVAGVTPGQLFRGEAGIESILRRGRECHYETNPWRNRHGFSLQSFMARSVSDLQKALEHLQAPASAYDNGRLSLAPALDEKADFMSEAALAGKLSVLSDKLLASSAVSPVKLPVFSATDATALRKAMSLVETDKAALNEPLDAELRLGYDSAPRPLPEVTADLAALREYLQKGLGFFGFFQFSVRGRAKEATNRYGLALNETSAKRLVQFLDGVRNRVLMQGTLAQHVPDISAAPLRSDKELSAIWEHCGDAAAFMLELDCEKSWSAVAAQSRVALGNTETAGDLPDSFKELQQDLVRRGEFMLALQQSQLFNDSGLMEIKGRIARGEEMTPVVANLKSQFDRLECLVRMEEEAQELPGPLGAAVLSIAAAGYDTDNGLNLLAEPVLEAEIKRRLEHNRELTSMDATAIQTAIKRIQDLQKRKREMVSEWINWKWTDKQRTRLLAGTGSRLNSDGADLRRRLALRGKNATRVRQVIQQGANMHAQDDPLFDVCPVWMASPETVAQLFPLEPVFDAVVFDEASQCRLEQGVGVLARGNRVIIAGDTRQLPPTRFFESAAVSGIDAELDHDDPDALFTSQQSDIEDLLTAALNIEVDQSFLEVHYRSSRTELIEFSNQAFYGGRLQALPARPSATATEPAVRMHQINGTYEKRQNLDEANHVVELVKKWLSQAKPPSIGIVTFNLNQKDLITDRLEEEASENEDFRKLLENARTRQGDGSFEGLFVKNLESVQGDERDVIILSCTYGADSKGKFYRRFGPLALAGGERRLNVIVTRARDVVEVVSSIPESEYMSLDNVPDGSKPTGSWHFMNYLRYAANLSRAAGAIAAEVEPDNDAGTQNNAHDNGKKDASARKGMAAITTGSESVPRSQLVDALSAYLSSRHQVQPFTYLGTEGFHVDLAFAPAPGEAGISSSIQVDGSRFTKAPDPAEWEVYQDGILRMRDWKPQGLWSPQVFRDPVGTAENIAVRAQGKA